MPTNWWMFLVVGLVPMIVGAIWYGPLFESKWMKVNKFTKSDLEGGNMAVIFGLSYLFSVMVAFFLSGVVIHQGGVAQMMLPEIMESGSPAANEFNDLMARYGDRYRSWGHGALHGAMVAIFFALPVIAIKSLFERRGWTYTFIHTGYWTVCLTIMGAVLCQLLDYAPA